MAKTIKAILIDLDDTLHDYTTASNEAKHAVFSAISEAFDLSREEVEKEFSKISSKLDMDAFAEGKLSDFRKKQFTDLLLAFGILDDEFADQMVKLRNEVFYSKIKLHDDVLDVLERLKSRYYLYLVTEGYPVTQNKTIDTLGIRHCVDGIFISAELGKTKSSGELFMHVLEKHNLLPEDVVVVGDNFIRDIKGAKEKDISAIWLNRKNAKHTADYSPDSEIYDVSDLELAIEFLKAQV